MWTKKTTQRLVLTALFAVTRGAAMAAGSAVVAGCVWWLQHR